VAGFPHGFGGGLTNPEDLELLAVLVATGRSTVQRLFVTYGSYDRDVEPCVVRV
jgi:hypothetical protein